MDAPRGTTTATPDSVPARLLGSWIRDVFGLLGTIDGNLVAVLVAPAAGSLSGLDLEEPLRLGAVAVTGAVLAWFAVRG
jgi:hypothetical protein